MEIDPTSSSSIFLLFLLHRNLPRYKSGWVAYRQFVCFCQAIMTAGRNAAVTLSRLHNGHGKRRALQG